MDSLLVEGGGPWKGVAGWGAAWVPGSSDAAIRFRLPGPAPTGPTGIHNPFPGPGQIH